MKRRVFVKGVAALSAAAALPDGARAQARQPWRVAWLSPARKNTTPMSLAPFLEGMAALGYVAGRNLVVDEAWGDNSVENMARLAQELAARKPAVVVAQGPALFPARKLPPAVPVVFAFSGDPVDAGAARSFARPGYNLTGVSFLALELVGKRVELLREIMPRIKRIGVVANPEHPGDTKELAATSEAARRFGLQVSYHATRKQVEVEPALAGAAAAGAEAVIAHPNFGILQASGIFSRFSLQKHIPVMSGWAEFAEGGNLLSYGPNLKDGYRRLAYFVDRILKGANPAELPIELPRTVELVLNLKIARALGLKFPQSLLQRADEVIE